MKSFKTIFHIIYVIIILIILYFSVDILINTDQYLSKINPSLYIKLPRYITGVFLFISIIMLFEFVMQQFKIYSIKSDMEDLEDEIKEIKVKLYDKSQEEDDDEDNED